MKRVTLNFIIDSISFLALLGLTLTGFIIKYILPPGSGGRGQGFRGGRGAGEIKSLFSMTRHEWGDIHFYLASLFIVLMIVHLVLHWTSIKCYFQSILRPKECEV